MNPGSSDRETGTLSSGTPVYVTGPPDAERGLVLFPDIGGLRPLFFDMCDALAAEHRWAVAAIELWPGQEELPLDARLTSVGTLDDARFMADAQEAAAALGVSPVGVLGFCMGGMLALKAAALDTFDRVISCYGMIRVPDHWRSATMADAIDGIHAGGQAVADKVLAIVATVDPFLPPEDVAELEALGASVVRYEGAEHGFMHDPSRPSHRADDASDAWRRISGWLDVAP